MRGLTCGLKMGQGAEWGLKRRGRGHLCRGQVDGLGNAWHLIVQRGSGCGFSLHDLLRVVDEPLHRQLNAVVPHLQEYEACNFIFQLSYNFP